MNQKKRLMSTVFAAALAVLVTGVVISAQDRYTVKVPGGLAFSEFRGYETWDVINVSQNAHAAAVILGNPALIDAYKAGFPANGKPAPDGAKFAKIHWQPKLNASTPGSPTVGGTQINVDFMVKDSKRFADSGGWGWAVFDFDPATQSFRPGDTNSKPPQANDAKCGLACHTIVKDRDYVFTEYPTR
jgi:cytochrome P460